MSVEETCPDCGYYLKKVNYFDGSVWMVCPYCTKKLKLVSGKCALCACSIDARDRCLLDKDGSLFCTASCHDEAKQDRRTGHYVAVSTSRFKAEHGVQPRGMGVWGFIIDGQLYWCDERATHHQEVNRHIKAVLYSVAKKTAIAQAKAVAAHYVDVAP